MTVAVVILTGLLVLVTGYYAYQTRRTVEELRHARGAGVIPKIALSMEHLGAGVAFVKITNVGVGPAMDVRLRMQYEPDGPSVSWESAVMVPGERALFTPARGEVHVPELAKKFTRVRLTGTCFDALDESHSFEQSLDFSQDWQSSVDSKEILDVDQLKRIGDELEKIRRETEHIRSIVKRP